jgi:hypothetical protein
MHSTANEREWTRIEEVESLSLSLREQNAGRAIRQFCRRADFGSEASFVRISLILILRLRLLTPSIRVHSRSFAVELILIPEP